MTEDKVTVGSILNQLQIQIAQALNEAKAAMAQSLMLAQGFNELVEALEKRDMDVELKMIELRNQINLIFRNIVKEDYLQESTLDKPIESPLESLVRVLEGQLPKKEEKNDGDSTLPL